MLKPGTAFYCLHEPNSTGRTVTGAWLLVLQLHISCMKLMLRCRTAQFLLRQALSMPSDMQPAKLEIVVHRPHSHPGLMPKDAFCPCTAKGGTSTRL